ncbi:Uncharacterised protein [Bordetella pertussis]|nr:Uncharacterised protein [Bordetella pertussis]CFW41900.1 Uncharacterised protein [Bordetella pertussis]
MRSTSPKWRVKSISCGAFRSWPGKTSTRCSCQAARSLASCSGCSACRRSMPDTAAPAA